MASKPRKPKKPRQVPEELRSVVEKGADGEWLPSDECLRRLRLVIGPKILLGFSCGKDSLAVWLALRRHFEEIVPFYREYVPGLAFVERSLQYYERFFGTAITRVPNVSFWSWLDTAAYQTKESFQLAEESDIYREITNNDILCMVCAERGLDPNALWNANGWRRTDSIARAFAIKQRGPVWPEAKRVDAIYDWSDQRMVEEFQKAGIKLPVDYKLFGRSFDSIRGAFLVPIKQHFPDDYERIKKFFPLIDIELRRMRGEDYSAWREQNRDIRARAAARKVGAELPDQAARRVVGV